MTQNTQTLPAHTPQHAHPTTALEWCSYAFAALALFFILKFGLIVALFSGLLIYALTNALAPFINAKTNSRQARSIAVVLLLLLIVTALCAGVFSAIAFFKSEAGSLPNLLQKLSDILTQSRAQLPAWVLDHLPEGVDELKAAVTTWMSNHLADAKSIGQDVGHIVVQFVLGTVIGAMLAFQDTQSHAPQRPLAQALSQRVAHLASVFQKAVFAQVQISLINTVFTAIYLMAVLPMLGIALPLTKTLVLITFVTGLIPVVGNIISNTAIFLVGLSVSLPVAMGALLFTVVIHKLEYFLNAKIIGAQIKASAWEMLCAILLMETLFGLPGLVAAPVFYAYLKKELMDKDLV
jgi:predicted PurR-regulated permease PerM